MSERIVYRFRRDLRLDDHLGLARAAAYGRVVPVLVLDRETVRRVGANARRAAFFCQAVAQLDELLRARGSRLIVRRAARAGRELVAVARSVGASAVAWAWTYDGPGIADDRDAVQDLEEAGIRALVVHDAPVASPEEVDLQRHAGGEGYRSFAPFHAAWRRVTLTPAAAGGPRPEAFQETDAESGALPTPGDFGQPHVEPPMAGGAPAAQARLAEYLAGPAREYAAARRVFGGARTSRLGGDLALGTLSARRTVRDLRALASRPFAVAEERRSYEELERSLAMRDFFLHLSWHWPRTHDRPLQEKALALRFADDAPGVAAWEAGTTGYPLVDAAMRELHALGWMHPKARAVAASFLCFDLGVSWRRGREIFDRHLIEDDLALATGNWQWVAGVGADMAQYPRIYNPVRQARTFDPDGAYVRRWIPELDGVPAARIHAPFAEGARPQLELPLFGAERYPRPAVDHEAAAREFLRRYRAAVLAR
ncbi:MAG TPA: deoxyribodipyrimidine photo-lyase [Candidatus Dormibacteraeota bacterium]|nr:deoxyribodipyrimidine photo-lyase [Candidatus Dormibacteraeota bacterium]